ncbi:MAG: glycosyltransferase family 9 protein [Ignavibacteriales bacterium]|nr:glycosyltransferase family 9 protein [Ignavibacteriales bacterium]
MPQEKILVIQTAFLGDAVLTLPMIQELKNLYSNSEIDVLCIPSTAEIFSNSPFVSRVFVYDKKGGQKSLVSLLKLIIELKSFHYTKIYSPHRSFRSTIIARFANAKETFSFDKSSFSFLYKHKMKYDNTKHEVARNLELIGFDFARRDWKILPLIKITPNVKNTIEKFSGDENKKYIAIAPGSLWDTKKYPQEYFLEVSKNLAEKNFFLFFIGGQADKELCEKLSSYLPDSSTALAGKLSIIESIALLQKCSLLISNDSAPTHLAMAADIPTLTIYCSTVPAFGFYPYNSQSKIISFDELACKPCGIHGYEECPIKTFECAFKLKPGMVIEKINQILNREEK